MVESRDHFSGGRVDAYKPKVVRLSLALEATVVAELVPGSREFSETAKVLDKVRRIPLHEMLTEVGGAVPHKGQDFRLDWQELVDLARADELFFDGLLDDSDEKTGEAAWIRFSYTRAFKEAPCARDEFDAIQREFCASDYVGGMDLGDYYSWWRQSQKMMTGAEVSENALAAAGRMLDAWSNDRDPKSLKYWLCRNLEVHPRHRPAFEQLVDERVAATAGDAPASPAP